MKKLFIILTILFSISIFAQTPRAGGINNLQATVLTTVHDNFVGVQSTNLNAFAVYSFATNFNYNLGLKFTDDIAEGSINKYFSNTLARNAFSAGTGLNYSAGIYSLDPTTLGTLASVSGKFNTPTGLTTQYLRGDGSLALFPIVYSFTGTNLQYTRGDGTYATFPSIITYSAGSGINITSGVISNTLPDQTVVLTGINGIVTSGTYPNFTITKKKQEVNSGVTNASGIYTYTFPVSYTVAPNIQASIINATDTQNIRITSISTTAVTVLVRNRIDVVGLLPTWVNVTGASVDILITEK